MEYTQIIEDAKKEIDQNDKIIDDLRAKHDKLKLAEIECVLAISPPPPHSFSDADIYRFTVMMRKMPIQKLTPMPLSPLSKKERRPDRRINYTRTVSRNCRYSPRKPCSLIPRYSRVKPNFHT
jgi:hypothetical protein